MGFRDGEWTDLSSQESWNFNYQGTYHTKDVTIRSSDVLSGTCVWDTTKKKSPTKLGLSTYEEMCVATPLVNYPRPSQGPLGEQEVYHCVGGVVYTGELTVGEDGRQVQVNQPWFTGDDVFAAEEGGWPSFSGDHGTCSVYPELSEDECAIIADATTTTDGTRQHWMFVPFFFCVCISGDK